MIMRMESEGECNSRVGKLKVTQRKRQSNSGILTAKMSSLIVRK